MQPDELAHFGVKGMKWGKRKSEDESKSNRQKALEAHYQLQGKTKSEAAKIAADRVTTEKILATVGVVTLAAATAYVGYRAYDSMFSGVNIKEGTVVKNINALGKKRDLNDRIYVSFKKEDLDKYRAMLPDHFKRQAAALPNPSKLVYETSYKTVGSIKAPSQAKAVKLFSEFQKVHGFKNNELGTWPDFNTNTLLNGGETAKSFSAFLKLKGYNAVLDYNDQFVSGFDTKKPLIIFNANSSLIKSGQKIIASKSQAAAYKKVTVRAITENSLLNFGIGAGAASLMGYAGSRSEKLKGELQ